MALVGPFVSYSPFKSTQKRGRQKQLNRILQLSPKFVNSPRALLKEPFVIAIIQRLWSLVNSLHCGLEFQHKKKADENFSTFFALLFSLAPHFFYRVKPRAIGLFLEIR